MRTVHRAAGAAPPRLLAKPRLAAAPATVATAEPPSPGPPPRPGPPPSPGPPPPEQPPPIVPAPRAASFRLAKERAGRRRAAVLLGLSAAALTAAAGVPPVGRAPAPGTAWESVGMVADYDAPERRWDAGHRGVDLAAAEGDTVVAPADGVVSFAGTVAGRPTVSIEVGGGWRTTLEPVAPSVAAGDAVRAGSIVGTVSRGGHCSARCVHWGLKSGHGRKERYRDPRTLAQDRRPSVLWIDEHTPPR
ncbi:MAG: M23 family metallopeptidase [Arthrobacter sp.]|nr:M23 family metallopeptidase [Arthrobacter sp.]